MSGFCYVGTEPVRSRLEAGSAEAVLVDQALDGVSGFVDCLGVVAHVPVLPNTSMRFKG